MEVLTTVDEERITRLLADDTFFWLDLVEPSARDLDALASLLGLHPAAIELSQNEYEDEDEDEILYHVLDALADGWDPVVDEVDRRVDEVEAQVLERPQRGQLTTIYRLKQEVGELLRHAGPQRAGFVPATRIIHHLEGQTHGARMWLRDVETHVDSIDSDLRRLSGDLSALTDTFFNANANRLNRLATLIAIGSMFFLIWTFVTGFFGQNFGYLVRHIDSREAFFAYEIGALVIPTLLLAGVLWWRRRDWW